MANRSPVSDPLSKDPHWRVLSLTVKEAEFKDRDGGTRVVRRNRQTHRLQVKQRRVTPALAYNQPIAALVGQRIKTLRIARGYELAELCTRAGIASSTPKSRMWEIENSTRSQGLRLGTLYALAVALDVDVGLLLPTTDEVQKLVLPRAVPEES